MKTKLLLFFLLSLACPILENCQTLDNCFSQYSTEIEAPQSKPSIQFLEGTEKFKTAINNAYQDGVNFAGHYVIASWGCGTACQSHAIINSKNGEAKFLPFSTVLGIDYRADSNLLIKDVAKLNDEYRIDSLYKHLEVKYYVMESDSLNLIRKNNIPKACKNNCTPNNAH